MTPQAHCTQAPATKQNSILCKMQPLQSRNDMRRAGVYPHRLRVQVLLHAAKPQPAGGSKPKLNQWLQDVAESHRQMATSMGILGGGRQQLKSQSPSNTVQDTVRESTLQECADVSNEVAGTADSISGSSSSSPIVAANQPQEHPRTLKASPSPSPSPARFISNSPQPIRQPAASTSQPSQEPIHAPTRDQLRSIDDAAVPEYGNDPEFEVPNSHQPIEPWPMPEQQVGPHSGLEAQDAADYEARILAAEARDSLLAAMHITSGSGSGMSSDDEDVRGSTELVEAIRQAEQRAISIRQASRNKSAAAEQQHAPAAAANLPEATASKVTSKSDSVAAGTRSSPLSARPPLVRPPIAAAEPVVPASTAAAADVTTESHEAAHVKAAPVSFASTEKQAAKPAPMQAVAAPLDAAGSTSVDVSTVQLPGAEESAPVPLAVAARVLAAQNVGPHVSRWDSDLDDMIDESTTAIQNVAAQPNRFLNTQFLEPLSADSLTLAVELLQQFGQPPADRAASPSTSMSSSSLDELLTTNEEALDAEPQLHAVRMAMEAKLAASRGPPSPPGVAGEADSSAQQQGSWQAVAASKEDEELCAALGMPPGPQGLSSNVVEFLRARRAEEVGL